MLKLNRIVLPSLLTQQNVSYSMYKHLCKQKLLFRSTSRVHVRHKKSSGTSLFIPVHIKPITDPADSNVGKELTGGTVDKSEMVKILNKFYQRQEIKIAAMDHGLDSMYHLSFLLLLRITEKIIMNHQPQRRKVDSSVQLEYNTVLTWCNLHVPARLDFIMGVGSVRYCFRFMPSEVWGWVFHK